MNNYELVHVANIGLLLLTDRHLWHHQLLSKSKQQILALTQLEIHNTLSFFEESCTNDDAVTITQVP